MNTAPYCVRAFQRLGRRLSRLSDTNVLIYFPHGFGDWIHFSHILSLLEQTNQYYITRFGDDTVSLMDGCIGVTPFYLGTASHQCAYGGLFSNRHFGMDLKQIHGEPIELNFPLSLHATCVEHSINALLTLPFIDVVGYRAFPYHTKARALLTSLIPPDDPRFIALSAALPCPINFDVPTMIQQFVENRLINFLGLGIRKLCLISRGGYTTPEKFWGRLWRDEVSGCTLSEGEECRDFMRLMLAKDPDWIFLSMEDRIFEGDDTLSSDEIQCVSYAQVFGSIGGTGLPFGLVMKALVNIADLCVGVPSGPYHLSMVKPDLPCIGIWTNQFPSWYDEPKEDSIHVISKNVVEKGYMDRPGSFTEMGGLKYDCRFVDTRRITGEQVMAAAEELLY
jgi:hypothetical protein